MLTKEKDKKSDSGKNMSLLSKPIKYLPSLIP